MAFLVLISIGFYQTNQDENLFCNYCLSSLPRLTEISSVAKHSRKFKSSIIHNNHARNSMHHSLNSSKTGRNRNTVSKGPVNSFAMNSNHKAKLSKSTSGRGSGRASSSFRASAVRIDTSCKTIFLTIAKCTLLNAQNTICNWFRISQSVARPFLDGYPRLFFMFSWRLTGVAFTRLYTPATHNIHSTSLTTHLSLSLSLFCPDNSSRALSLFCPDISSLSLSLSSALATQLALVQCKKW